MRIFSHPAASLRYCFPPSLHLSPPDTLTSPLTSSPPSLSRLGRVRQVHGDFELSIPGAVQALRFSLDVYGAGKIELVPCYLLLAEANLGLGRHKQAEEYLSLANWSILKNPDCSNRTKSQLYRNFGKLYASQVLYAINPKP